MQQIPLNQIPAQTLRVMLADQPCVISVYWRQARLYLDLSVGAKPICRGAVCQNRADIVQTKSQNFAGTLHFLDLEGDSPPLWNQLRTGALGQLDSQADSQAGGQADSQAGGRWALLYVDAEEELPEILRY